MLPTHLAPEFAGCNPSESDLNTSYRNLRITRTFKLEVVRKQSKYLKETLGER